MVTNSFIDNAKVMSKGQVTIPKDVREALGIEVGDRVTFVVENGSVRIYNSAVYAMKMLQVEMTNVAQNAGLVAEDDVIKYVKDVRKENK